MNLPLYLTFERIRVHKINILRYIILSVYFLNKATMLGDGGDRGLQMVKASIKFQVMEHFPMNYLIDIDVIKSYKMVIDLAKRHVTFDSLYPPVRILILNGNRYKKMKYNPHIFTTQTVFYQAIFRLLGPDPLRFIKDREGVPRQSHLSR